MVNNPGFTLNDKDGGFNWGYCKEEKKESKDEQKDIKYSALVVTSQIEKSETEYFVIFKSQISIENTAFW